MAVTAAAASATCNLNHTRNFLSSKPHFNSIFGSSRNFPAKSRSSTIVSMAPQKKVNKLDSGWEKKWYGAGIFYEGAEEVEVDVFKKLEKRKVLSNVEKAGLLSKAEELGVTLSSIEKLGLFSKAEELGLLSLLEKVAGFSPAALASAALPILVAAVVAVVVIPDDSAALVAAQAVVAGVLGAGAAGLLVGSVVLDVCTICPSLLAGVDLLLVVEMQLICNRRADGLDRNAGYGGILASPNHHETLAHSVMSVAGLFVDLTDHLEKKAEQQQRQFMRMDNKGWHRNANFQKVFDLILEMAVNANSKPEQMIKKLYLFTSDQDFDDASDLFWDLRCDENVGVTAMSGNSEDFVECFLDNDGDVDPEQVMKVAISGEGYQNLAVVD
ncbi:hypothetical protein D8674_037751 [Pyrus ussuriensis x Pyrus communis]|uniref:DUF7788 domain-containing protein n=1 Tax=Pyrus ussuriensis x Pyrus communis TaxID=2448454 RepID=A0A5N5FR12_9ROSA|nr:hypothetical protein D8674_037751 [Pyrus ussuriensis x Pyrus communis]